jgi:hypothetical protein
MKYIRDIMAGPGRCKEMENWKRVLIAGSTGLSVMCFLKHRRAGGFLLGGVALAALASEYPKKFGEIRTRLPEYMRRGAALLTVASQISQRLADAGDARDKNSVWNEGELPYV